MVFPFFCFYAGITMEKLPLLSPTPPPTIVILFVGGKLSSPLNKFLPPPPRTLPSFLPQRLDKQENAFYCTCEKFIYTEGTVQYFFLQFKFSRQALPSSKQRILLHSLCYRLLSRSTLLHCQFVRNVS